MPTTTQIGVIAAVLVIVLGVALLVAGFRFANTGRVVTVGCKVYFDPQLTLPVETLNWGDVRPGDVVSKSVYVVSTEILPATLSINTSAWVPLEAEQYLTLAWDYQNQTLNIGDIQQVTLNLQVSISVHDITSFSFDITVWATET